VKGTAVSSTWLNDIIATSQSKLREEGDESTPNRKGISIDAKLVLMLVLPIRFANLKATDLVAVSKLCCVVVQFVQFVLTHYPDEQVIRTYGIRDLFREAINACDDITCSEFPQLYLNKNGNKTSGNISRITRQGIRRLMIFIARLYEAHFIMDRLGTPTTKPPGSFSFTTYPILKPMFTCIEGQLSCSQSISEDQESCLTDLVQSITVDIAYCKKMLNLGVSRVEKLESASMELSKRLKSIERHKVKKSSKRKKDNGDELAHFARLYTEMRKKKSSRKKLKVDRV